MIVLDGKKYQSNPGESVLDCLLRHGVDMPYSCRGGVCQTCLMRAVRGEPEAAAQKGLKPAMVKQKFFLPCSCDASQELEIAFPDSGAFRFQTTVLSKDRLSKRIVRLRLQRPQGYDYYAGQYLTLYNSEGVGRNYSLASLPVLEPFLELHIRIVKGGRVSEWILNAVNAEDEVTIGQAIGNCVYTKDDMEQPLLLIGTGSGLAPLYGILRDALHQGHRGPIALYHGSGNREGIYLGEELRTLASHHANFTYIPCVSQGDAVDGFTAGRALDIALGDHPKLQGWKAYLCGDAEMVKAASRAVFLAGVSLKDVYSDAFLPSQPLSS